MSCKSLLVTSLFVVLTACGGGGGGSGGSTSPDAPTAPPTTGAADPDYADLRVFAAGSPYASALKPCASLDIDLFASGDSCALSDLPFIGQDSSNPTVDDIMARVLVSHDWMGERFRDALEFMPDDMRLLFRSITAIVIDSDIRPAYYWGGTAAIYIDPAYLWTTNAEKDTVSKEQDYRAGFGDELNFVDTWRYTLNDNYAYRNFPLDGTEERTVAEMALPLTRLFYHELAHANDFMPPQQLSTLSRNLSALEALDQVSSSRVSSRLYNEFNSPLRSEVMLGLADVRFRTGEPNADQKTYTADYVGSEHENDAANHFYGYSTLREDLAMMFEAVMMKRNFGIEMDVGYLYRPENQDPSCDDYKVGWGKRNLIGSAVVKPRVLIVAREILPELEWDDYLNGMDGEKTMTTNAGWCTNLSLGSSTPIDGRSRTGIDAGEAGWQDLSPRIH